VVVGHGTVVTGTVAVPPRRCAASVIDLPRLCAGSGTPPLRLLAVTVLVLVGGVARSPEHVVSDCVAVDGDVAVCYQPVSWMRFDADLALSRARFIGPDTAQQELVDSLTGFPQAQIGNAPGNPTSTKFTANKARLI
jgi:hypothetical protein